MDNYEKLYDLALAYAAVKHEGQTDRAGIPYIEHPKTVSAWCHTQKAKICALLHDTLEDTDATEEELRRFFGDEIADIVVLLTKSSEVDEDHYQDYIHQLAHDATAREVKLADLHHNMDLTRTWPIRESDVHRLEKKYVPAYNYLMQLERDADISDSREDD